MSLINKTELSRGKVSKMNELRRKKPGLAGVEAESATYWNGGVESGNVSPFQIRVEFPPREYICLLWKNRVLSLFRSPVLELTFIRYGVSLQQSFQQDFHLEANKTCDFCPVVQAVVPTGDVHFSFRFVRRKFFAPGEGLFHPGRRRGSGPKNSKWFPE